MVYRNPYNGYSEGEYGGYSQEEYTTDYSRGPQQDLRGPTGQDRYYGTQERAVWSSSGEQLEPATIPRSQAGGGTGLRQHYPVQGSPQTTAGSQTVLITKAKENEQWPRGSDHLFTCWAFTISLHSLWTLPMVIVQQGGLAFLLIYAILVALLGAPLLLLELALGQYSALPTARLYRHLCPLLSGLGLAFTVLASVRGILDLAVLMWSGHSLFHLFSYQKIGQEFFNRDILDREDSSLGELGGLRNQILLVLGIATLTTFVFIVAGTKSVGKVCMVAVPAAFMLMMTLTIRACLATGGPQGVLLLLAPDWSVLTLPGAWLEAAAQVVFSLQLGLGALTTFASYNKYEHNLVRDTAIMAVAHLVWLLLALLLTYALLGLAQNAEVLQLPVEVNKEATGAMLLSNTGTGIWLAAVTLGEKAFSTLSYGWLWAGLYFILVIIVGVTSLFGYIEVITSTLVSIKPSYSRFKPLIAFFVLAVLFLLDLVLATQGGIHIYHLLSTYIASWPTLLFSLLTVTATLGCHGAGFLMRDLSDMSKFRLSHWVQAHLSVIFYSLLPIALTATLVWHLYGLSSDHLEEPLAAFGMALPSGWGLPLAWALSALPLTPLLLGAVLQLAWIRRGVPFTMHLKRLVKPTDRYYRNEHLESAGSGPNAQNTSTRA